MSGLQGGGCHFDNALSFLLNFERATTCRYYIRYVVAYVVRHVEGAVLYSSLAEASTRPVGDLGFRASSFPYTVCMKNFVVESGDFITTSGIYRMNDQSSAAPRRRSCRRSRGRSA